MEGWLVGRVDGDRREIREGMTSCMQTGERSKCFLLSSVEARVCSTDKAGLDNKVSEEETNWERILGVERLGRVTRELTVLELDRCDKDWRLGESRDVSGEGKTP